MFEKPNKSAVPAEKDPMASSEKLYLDTTPPKGKGVGRLMPAIVFVVFILGMAIWFIFNPKSDFSASEKRPLQKFPDASLENIISGDFGTEFESYFADHFPARNLWVGFNAYYQLDTGNNGASGIYRCKDGYLINKPVENPWGLQDNINVVTDFKQTVKDTPMTMMLVPSTGYVCDDVLPLIHNAYEDDAYFADAAQKLSDGGVSFIDLRDSFKQAYRDGKQLYYKTDHHWTTYGAYLGAYRYLHRNSAIEKTDITEIMAGIETYAPETKSSAFLGALYSRAPLSCVHGEDLDLPQNLPEVTVTIGNGTGAVYVEEKMETKDKYSTYFGGNHSEVVIENPACENGKTLVLIKDSFANSMVPYLMDSYSKIIMLDLRYFDGSVMNYIKEAQPDEILFLYELSQFAEAEHFSKLIR